MCLAQAVVGLIARAIEHTETLLDRARGRCIGITLMQAQFEAGSAPGFF
jgi:hypothetical protein